MQQDLIPIQKVSHYSASHDEIAAAEDAVRDVLGDQPVPKSEPEMGADLTPLAPFLEHIVELGFTLATGLITNAMYDVLKPKALALLDHLKHDKRIKRKTKVHIWFGDHGIDALIRPDDQTMALQEGRKQADGWQTLSKEGDWGETPKERTLRERQEEQYQADMRAEQEVQAQFISNPDDTNAQQALVTYYRDVVDEVVDERLAAHPDLPREELVTAGNAALIEAARRYLKPHQQTNDVFATFAGMFIDAQMPQAVSSK